ncbi:hypothetical protein CONCODRAFT_79327 [Conidiobolus coronatus NRRL 28638]|uniref:Oxidative stress survival, Svf1-like protein n=1 Tax=Conidiobolus coronatus (strain ATCC 28846 / CBS 209.66 / NRRL 28638) TaxID=796925 RepID=A0A137P2Z5_CONC2|nr:hypothetical protein CONCODRAFT_79327 [Conidiobolus coronatus NRRL 28638]|eukprot:KXN69400.1 hypothetical protein CONCODRAFT_79327 [Conidiobolus coronatus NRRL 28638]
MDLESELITQQSATETETEIMTAGPIVIPAKDRIAKGQPYYTPLTEKDLTWKVPNNAATETQSFYFVTEDNKFMFFQLAFAVVGWIHNVQISYNIIDTDKSQFKTITCSSSSFKTSSDKLSAECDNLAYERTADPKTGLSIYKVHFKPPSGLQGEFTFICSDNGAQIGADGTSYVGTNQPSGAVKHGLLYSNQVQGHVAAIDGDLKGRLYQLNGQGLFVHATIGDKPYSVLSTSYFTYFRGKDTNLLSLQYFPPSKYNYSGAIDVTVVYKEGRLFTITAESELTRLDNIKDPDTELSTPKRVNLKFDSYGIKDGKLDTEAAKLGFELSTNELKLYDRVDVISNLPYFIRKIIQAFITKPYIYEYFQPATLSISNGEQTEVIEGNLFYELSYC